MPTISLYLTDKEKLRIKHEAVRRKSTVSGLIRTAIATYLGSPDRLAKREAFLKAIQKDRPLCNAWKDMHHERELDDACRRHTMRSAIWPVADVTN